MKYQSSHRYARISPRKARYVIDMIRGKSVNEALNILRCSNQRAGYFIGKVLNTAIANADSQGAVDVNKLVVSVARVDGGPTWKRFRPGPMGRAMRIRKRTSHITVVVEEKEESKN